MNRYFVWISLLIFAASLYAQDTLSCYDIQYTTSTSGDSPYTGQIVSVEGVVSGERFYTGSNSSNFGFFISDAEGGPWSGLFVYNQTNQPSLGDLVRLTGTVTEYYGFTEITSVSAFQVLSTGNPLPAPAFISTGSLTGTAAEQWESVFVKVQNATVTTAANMYQEFNVSDGSGSCQIDNSFFPIGHSWTNINTGLTFSEIRGIVEYGFSIFAIHPRSMADMIVDGQNLSLILPNITCTPQSNIQIPISAMGIDPAAGYQRYQFNFTFNPAVLQYQNVSSTGTMSEGAVINVVQNPGSLGISCQNASSLSGDGDLLRINFFASNTGTSSLNLNSAFFDQDEIVNIISGSVTVNASYNTPGDTLTVIQHPILNVPEIVLPAEQMTITCLAPANTTNWQANLKHGTKIINLPINSTEYVNTPDRWLLHTTIPNVPVYELYDLEVIASGAIHDVSRNAVQVLPTRKTNYYFAHITDLHMPNRVYWPNAGFDADSMAVVDFRAVMDDLNLIRPEFVLITGDVINEGELEGFAGQYWFGWAQKLFSEFQIPFYLTAGNHDIGGWNSTPPPAGSSRQNWWKYFGWKWLDNANSTWTMHTQDYSFSYGNTHFIGLESYDNYDNWRSYIYGGQSYTLNQMNWLNNTLALYPSHKKVLFHHYDFSDQINLSSLGIDLSLWGHIHSNSGSTSTQPYNLSTRSVCDGNRSYRIVRINGEQIIPYTTIYAGESGQNINSVFYPNNYGYADSVMVTVRNNQSIGFENALLKILMPSGSSDYMLSGGVMEQVDESAEFNICYVKIILSANSTVNVSLKANSVSNSDPFLLPAVLTVKSLYPNPFRENSTLVLETKTVAPLQVSVYNLRGELITTLYNGKSKQGEQLLHWDGRDKSGNHTASGIYLIKIVNGKSVKMLKTVKVK